MAEENELPMQPAQYSAAQRKYYEYLQSDHWRQVRKEFWASKRPKTCWVCDGPGRDLHHSDYSVLGRERTSYLILLCRECHGELHAMVRNEAIPLARAHNEIRRRMTPQIRIRIRNAPRVEFADPKAAAKTLRLDIRRIAQITLLMRKYGRLLRTGTAPTSQLTAHKKRLERLIAEAEKAGIPRDQLAHFIDLYRRGPVIQRLDKFQRRAYFARNEAQAA